MPEKLVGLPVDGITESGNAVVNLAIEPGRQT